MNTRMQWMSQANSPRNIAAPTREKLRTLRPATFVIDPEHTLGHPPLPLCYARGEIERAHFMQRLEDLNRN
ncbi:MAG: hypothetical protein WBG92_09250 [Thiohalocapsa sp.]